jgi:FkbM family methyltransferase
MKTVISLFTNTLHTLGALPIYSLQGPLRGSWWSLYPQSSYWRGTFEPEITTALLHALPPEGSCCWDLGAHFGFYSTVMARQVGPQGQVIALEPNPPSFQRLIRHRRWNKLHQMKAFPLAASNQNGTSQLINYGHNLDTATHLSYPQETHSTQANYTPIQTVRMDDFFHEQKLRPPHLIKIDVECHGAEVLLGCHSILKTHHPTIIFSVHDQHEYESMSSELLQLGYQIKLLDFGANSPQSPWPADYLASHTL